MVENREAQSGSDATQITAGERGKKMASEERKVPVTNAVHKLGEELRRVAPGGLGKIVVDLTDVVLVNGCFVLPCLLSHLAEATVFDPSGTK